MAAVVGARGTLPSYYTGAESRAEPAVISFEKELDYFTALIKRAGKKPATAESRQKVYVLSLTISISSSLANQTAQTLSVPRRRLRPLTFSDTGSDRDSLACKTRFRDQNGMQNDHQACILLRYIIYRDCASIYHFPRGPLAQLKLIS